jgi:hypothetical protein
MNDPSGGRHRPGPSRYPTGTPEPTRTASGPWGAVGDPAVRATRPCRWLLFLAFCLILVGCAELPEAVRPRFTTLTEPAAAVFTYRPLTRDDFRGPPPEEAAGGPRSFNARSTILIRPAPETQVLIQRSRTADLPLYFGTVNELRFEAVFVPEQSWWNPVVPEARAAYVLEHEQIHFALLELAARRLSREVASKRPPGLPVTDYTAIGARRAVAAWLARVVEDRANEILAEHERFDQDTSLRYATELQHRWWLLLEKRLEQESDP